MPSLEQLYPQLRYSQPPSLQMDRFLANMDMMQAYLVFCIGLLNEKKLNFYHMGEKHFYSDEVCLSETHTCLDIIKQSLIAARNYFQAGCDLREKNQFKLNASEDDGINLNILCRYFAVLFEFLLGDINKSIQLAKSEMNEYEEFFHKNLKDIYLFIINHAFSDSPFAILKAFHLGVLKGVFFNTTLLGEYPLASEALAQSLKLKMDLFFYTEEYGFNYQQVTWQSALLKNLYTSEYPDAEKMNVFTLEQNGGNQTAGKTIDILVDWHCLDFDKLNSSLSDLNEGGLCLMAVPRSQTDPEATRKKLEAALQTTCFLIDRESFSDILIVYGFKNKQFETRFRLLILMRPDSVQTIGGADLQLFKSRAYFKHAGIRSDISLACRLDSQVYDCIYIVGYYHEMYKFNYLNQSSLPKICMPIASLGFEESQIAHRFFNLYQNKLKKEANFNKRDELCPEKISFFRGLIEKEINLSLDYNKNYYVQLARVCDYFIPQSQKEMDLLFPNRDYKEFELVFNGCDFSDVALAKSSIFMDTYQIKDYIICVGRLQSNKNQLFLAYALRDTEIPLVLIGKEFSQDYLKLCQELGNSRIYYFEYLSSEMLLSALQNARLFVLPSFSEVSPLSSLEAAMMGVPVVLTQNSGQDEQFNGAFYYCDPWDPENIKDIVVKAYEADNTDKKIKAKEIAKKTSSWSIMADRIANIIYMLVGREKGDNYIQYQDRWFKLLPALAEDRKIQAETESSYAPNIYPIANLSTFIEKKYDPLLLKDVFLIVNTDYSEYRLKEMGFEKVIKQIPKPNQNTYLGGVSLALEDACEMNLLCLYDPQNIFSWQEVILAYIDSYPSDENNVLFVCAFNCDENQDVEEDISDYLIKKGYDLDFIPNISILTDFKAQKQLKDLFKSVDVLVFPLKTLWGYEPLYYQIVYSEKTVITHQFNLDLNTQNLICLAPFESLCQLPPLAEIPISVQTLSQCLKWADPRRRKADLLP